MLDKTDIHARLEAPVMKDYGVYLSVDRLLACQKPLGQLVTPDELQFQIVHQVEELWMKQPVRWRRALRDDLRRRQPDLHAPALGA